MKTILAHPLLRALFFRSIIAFLSMGLGLFTYYVLYAIRMLGLKPASLRRRDRARRRGQPGGRVFSRRELRNACP